MFSLVNGKDPMENEWLMDKEGRVVERMSLSR